MPIILSAITIRSFEPRDQAATRHLILTGLGEHFGTVDEDCNPDLDDIQGSYIDRGHLFLVAERHEQIVGTAALERDMPCGRLVRVSVDRAYRRCGLGRALVDRLLAAARAAGMAQFQVETNHDWEAALALYKSFGFMEYARDEVSAYLLLHLASGPDEVYSAASA